MKYVSHITSTVKKGVNCELGPRTLIVGPNASGKSSILNSLELALAGFASDVVGRQLTKKSGDLIILANNGQKLECTATLSTGEVSSWSTSATATGAKRPTAKGPKGTFPFLGVRDNLSGSAAKARLWLLKQFNVINERDEILSRFPEGLRSDYARWATNTRCDGTEIDLLLAVISKLGETVRTARSDAKALQQVLDETTMRLGPEPSEDHIAHLKDQEEDAFLEFGKWRDQAAAIPAPDIVERARMSAVVAAQQLIDAEKELDICVTAVNLSPAVSDQQLKIVDLRKKIIAMANLHVDLGVNSCMICESNGAPNFSHRATSLSAANAKISETLTWHDRHDQWDSKVISLRPTAQNALKKWQDLQAKAGTHGATIQSEAIDKKNMYQMANDHRVDAERARDEWKNARSFKDRIDEATDYGESAKKLERGCQDVVKSILRTAAMAFEDRVQTYLPKGDIFGLEISPHSDSCRFGLRHADGTLHSALSGAEWARVMLAIGCAITAKPNECVAEENLIIFSPEERAFDPKTLGAVMRALHNAPGQVILTSPVAPRKGAYLDSWTIVTLK